MAASVARWRAHWWVIADTMCQVPIISGTGHLPVAAQVLLNLPPQNEEKRWYAIERPLPQSAETHGEAPAGSSGIALLSKLVQAGRF